MRVVFGKYFVICKIKIKAQEIWMGFLEYFASSPYDWYFQKKISNSGDDNGYKISRTEPFEEMQTEVLTIRNIQKLYIPPKSTDNRYHDFAMVEFDDVKFTNRIRPICLPV